MSVKKVIQVKLETASTKEEKKKLFQDLYIANLWDKMPKDGGKHVDIQNHLHLPLIKSIIEQQFKHEGLVLEVPDGRVDVNRYRNILDLLANPAKTIHPALDPCFAIVWQRMTASRLMLLQGRITPHQARQVNDATMRLESLAECFMLWTKKPTAVVSLEQWSVFASTIVNECEHVVHNNGVFSVPMVHTPSSFSNVLDVSHYNVKRVFSMFMGDAWQCSFNETVRGSMERARRELLNAVHEVNIQFMYELKKYQ